LTLVHSKEVGMARTFCDDRNRVDEAFDETALIAGILLQVFLA
jgi:hypothetical protein